MRFYQRPDDGSQFTGEGKPEEIATLEYTESKLTVYNLTIEPDHTYVAGGVVSHNLSLKQGVMMK